MSKNKDKLTDFLTPDQLARLSHIRQYVTDLWAHGTPLHPFFTLHGAQHSQQVELIIEHILAPEHRDHHHLEKVLQREQILCLLASAWLHDTGMICPPTEEEKQVASEQGMTVSDWIRKVHHERSYKYVVGHARDLRLEPDEANTVGLVCQAHRGKNLASDRSLTTSFLNTRFLAAVLRVADALDISKARTPPQLMELRWNEMDSTSRWHWLKHWCILRADPRHEELKDEEPAILQLTYQLTIRLPNHRYLAPFWDRVIEPIREVLEEQGVDSIMRQKHLAVGHRYFERNVLLCNDTLPDGTGLEECMGDLLMPGAFLFSDAIVRRLNTLRSKNTVVADMLQRQCRRLTDAASPLSDVATQIKEALDQYLGVLATADNLSVIEDAHDRFGDIGRKILKETSYQESMSAGTEREWLKLSDLGWRLMGFVLGNEVERQRHLTHILWWLDTEANELSGWIAVKDASASLRKLAVRFLGKKGTPEFCHVVLEATRDTDAEVRVEAVNALRRFPGPRAYERLGQILGADIDGEVRRTAEEVKRESTNPPDTAYQKFTGRKVLLMDDERYVVPPLIDALVKQEIEVHVVTNATELQHILQDWTPDVVVCELLEVNPGSLLSRLGVDDPPGLYLARLVREKLGPDVPIITTSIINPEEIAAQLANIRSVYVRKPTTPETFVRTIGSLLSLKDSTTQERDKAQEVKIPTGRLITLRQNLTDAFNEGELRTLCFDLQVDYESLPGQGKADKARELVSYLDRRGLVPELVAKCRELRPSILWEDKSG